MEHGGLRHLPRLAICGHGDSGKDTCGKWFARHTPLSLGPTTSQIIAPYVAKRLGLGVNEAFARRRASRELWFDVGNTLRANDPAFLVRKCLELGHIAVGLRNADEVQAARRERLIDLFVWVDRDVPEDPTMTFGLELCDVVVFNDGSLEELYARLGALAKFAGILS